MISVTCIVWTSNKLQPTTSYTYKQILNVINVAVLFSKRRVYDSLGWYVWHSSWTGAASLLQMSVIRSARALLWEKCRIFTVLNICARRGNKAKVSQLMFSNFSASLCFSRSFTFFWKYIGNFSERCWLIWSWWWNCRFLLAVWWLKVKNYDSHHPQTVQ